MADDKDNAGNPQVFVRVARVPGGYVYQQMEGKQDYSSSEKVTGVAHDSSTLGGLIVDLIPDIPDPKLST